MVTKISSDMYKAEFETEALSYAKLLSKLEKDSFSIIASRGDIFIERGLDIFIRASEKLIAQYENGNLRSWR